METVVYSKHYPNFITITCLNWIPLLQEDRFKDIIIENLSFLCRSNRVSVYAFVIMSNHMHIIWQIMGENERQAVQRDFLKFTGQQILKILRNEKSPLQDKLLVNAKDRKFQVWERNSLSIPCGLIKSCGKNWNIYIVIRSRRNYADIPKTTSTQARLFISMGKNVGIF